MNSHPTSLPDGYLREGLCKRWMLCSVRPLIWPLVGVSGCSAWKAASCQCPQTAGLASWPPHSRGCPAKDVRLDAGRRRRVFLVGPRPRSNPGSTCESDVLMVCPWHGRRVHLRPRARRAPPRLFLEPNGSWQILGPEIAGPGVPRRGWLSVPKKTLGAQPEIQ